MHENRDALACSCDFLCTKGDRKIDQRSRLAGSRMTPDVCSPMESADFLMSTHTASIICFTQPLSWMVASRVPRGGMPALGRALSSLHTARTRVSPQVLEMKTSTCPNEFCSIVIPVAPVGVNLHLVCVLPLTRLAPRSHLTCLAFLPFPWPNLSKLAFFVSDNVRYVSRFR